MKLYAIPYLLLSAVAGAQAPSFEVASVKPNPSHSVFSAGSGLHNSRYSVQNATLRSLLQAAFDMPRSRIVGPDWIDAERFDIDAKAAAGTPDQQLPLMLQTLLTDRFHAVTHREAREMAAYDMIVAKGGLKAVLYDRDHPPATTGRVNFSGIGSLSQLADQLARAIGRPVIDRTGADGRYVYWLRYAPLSAGNADSDLPDIFTAAERQMGVKLVSRKEPIELLIIDHVERPTGN